jgi:very-short-patch-repair endonuclease
MEGINLNSVELENLSKFLNDEGINYLRSLIKKRQDKIEARKTKKLTKLLKKHKSKLKAKGVPHSLIFPPKEETTNAPKEPKRLKDKVDAANIKYSAEQTQLKLKQDQTPTERLFKARLKALGIKYEFQKIVYYKASYFIVDFYIIDRGLIIELDGEYHDNLKQKLKDSKRTEILNSLGYKRMLRISNKNAGNLSESDLLSKINQYSVFKTS